MNGSIDHRPDRPSPWRARYSAPDQRQRSKSFQTKRDAERWLRTELAKLDRGSWVDPAGGLVLYADHAARWLDGLVGIREKTRVGYDGLLSSRILPTFGNHQLRRIDPPSVRAWIAGMAGEGLSPSRIRQARQVLRASLDQAVHDGLIAKNPVTGIKVPTEPHREMKHLTANQLRELAEIADRLQPGAGVVITFLGYTGLRWGEMVALTRSSLDLLRRQIHVRQSATEVGGKLIFGSTKTNRSRTLIIPPSIAELVAAHLTPGAPEDPVFTAPRGGPLRSSNFRTGVWLPAVAELSTRHPELEGLRVHDLRHTAASLAISVGANIKAVQRMLGHKNASITLDRYSHLFIDDLEDLAGRLDERYREVA